MKGIYAPTPLGEGSSRAWGLTPSSSVGFVSFEKPTNRVYIVSNGKLSKSAEKFGMKISQRLIEQGVARLTFTSHDDPEGGVNPLSHQAMDVIEAEGV